MANTINHAIGTLIREINHLSRTQLVIAITFGIVGILWPLGGVLLYLLNKFVFAKNNLYGWLSIIGAATSMICVIAGSIITALL